MDPPWAPPSKASLSTGHPYEVRKSAKSASLGSRFTASMLTLKPPSGSTPKKKKKSSSKLTMLPTPLSPPASVLHPCRGLITAMPSGDEEILTSESELVASPWLSLSPGSAHDLVEVQPETRTSPGSPPGVVAESPCKKKQNLTPRP